MRRAIGKMVLVPTIALTLVVAVGAPALARWHTLADATLQVKKACVDGVVLDVGALSPRPLDSEPPLDLPATQDVVVRAWAGAPDTGTLILDTTVTVPLNPTVIKLTTGERAIIDYYQRFTLKWNQKLAVGQQVSLRAAALSAIDFIDQVPPLVTTIKNCRLCK